MAVGWNSKTAPQPLHRRPGGQRSRGPLRHPAALRGAFEVAAAGWDCGWESSAQARPWARGSTC